MSSTGLKCLLVTGVSAIAFATAANAQNFDEQTDDVSVQDVVVVTGIRGSQTR